MLSIHDQKRDFQISNDANNDVQSLSLQCILQIGTFYISHPMYKPACF